MIVNSLILVAITVLVGIASVVPMFAMEGGVPAKIAVPVTLGSLFFTFLLAQFL